MRHFSVKSLMHGYRNIFAFNGRYGYALPQITPDGFEVCTIGDRMKIECLFAKGDMMQVSDFGEIPNGYYAVRQYQPELNVTFFNLVHLNL